MCGCQYTCVEGSVLPFLVRQGLSCFCCCTIHSRLTELPGARSVSASRLRSAGITGGCPCIQLFMWVLGIELGSLVLHSKLFHPLTYLPGSKIALLVPKGEIRRNKGISSLKQVFPSVLQIKLRALCTLAKCYTSKLQSRALWPFGAHCPVYRWVKAPPAIAARPVCLASRSVAKASSPGQPAFFLKG